MNKRWIHLYILALLLALLPWCISAAENATDAMGEAAPLVTDPEDDMAYILIGLQADIDGCLNDLDSAVAGASWMLSSTGLEDVRAREILDNLTGSNAQLMDVVTVGLDGVILAAEPSTYQSYEGADISDQEHVIKLLQTRNPVMSAIFPAVEGFDAISIAYPVFSQSGEFLGGISAIVDPAEVLDGLVTPWVNGTDFGITITEKDGPILYDTDFSQIGKMPDDPLYQDSPELLELLEQVMEDRFGSGSYSFLDTDENQTVKKVAYWTTAGLHGREWRVAITKAVL